MKKPLLNMLLLKIALITGLGVMGAVFLGLAEPSYAEQSVALTQIEHKKVCMINNAVFEKDQIPVEVEGKTYYGCCEMCEAKLKKNPQSRLAIDPVSSKSVDKATSVIGATADGKVYYFESAENLARFKN